MSSYFQSDKGGTPNRKCSLPGPCLCPNKAKDPGQKRAPDTIRLHRQQETQTAQSYRQIEFVQFYVADSEIF